MVAKAGPATRRLRAVGDADKPKGKTKTLVSAADSSERELLVTMRTKIAAEIDGGVPAHALGRLMSCLRDVDKEIRQLDLRLRQERDVAAASVGADDEAWDPSAI